MSAVHASVSTRNGIARLRDLEECDVEKIVYYWFESGDSHLDFLGIDRRLLGSREDTRDRFLRAIPSKDADQTNIAFAITLDDEFVGYTLLNRHDPLTNYSHWHISDPRRRALGLSSALYPWRIRTYFDAVPFERLIHQTRTRNPGVNRMLDKFLPVAETAYIERPDGIALPGEFHLRYVHRADIPRLFEIAGRLSEARE